MSSEIQMANYYPAITSTIAQKLPVEECWQWEGLLITKLTLIINTFTPDMYLLIQ